MSALYSGYVDQPGLISALESGGVAPFWKGGQLYVSNLSAAQAIVASYNAIPFAQQQALAQVGATLDAKVAAGWTYNGSLIAIDSGSRANIAGKALQASLSLQSGSTVAWPSNMVWLPQGNGPSLALATAQDMINFGVAVGNYYTNLVLYAASLESQINAATSVSAVQAIDLTTGWPTS